MGTHSPDCGHGVATPVSLLGGPGNFTNTSGFDSLTVWLSP